MPGARTSPPKSCAGPSRRRAMRRASGGRCRGRRAGAQGAGPEARARDRAAVRRDGAGLRDGRRLVLGAGGARRLRRLCAGGGAGGADRRGRPTACARPARFSIPSRASRRRRCCTCRSMRRSRSTRCRSASPRSRPAASSSPITIAPRSAQPARDFVEIAERFEGTPYLWGGRTRIGLDCSGLVQLAMDAAGLAAPRDTDMQRAKSARQSLCRRPRRAEGRR